MKYIREGRFGPPKCGKTRHVVGTYPRPLLALGYDSGSMGGLSVINPSPKMLTPAEVVEYAKTKQTSQLDPISGVDMTLLNVSPLTDMYVPIGDANTFTKTVEIINALYHNCPWKTVVLDTISGLSDSILAHTAVKNASSLSDPRKWAGNIGMKVRDTIAILHRIKAHTVVILHEETNQDDTTKVISTQPMVYSKLREYLGAMFDQFLHAYEDNKVGKVRTRSSGLVKGIGVRWPVDLPETVNADFNSIYGKAGL